MEQLKGENASEAGRMDELSDWPNFSGKNPFRVAFTMCLSGSRQTSYEAGGPDDPAVEGGEEPAPFYPFRRKIRPFVFDCADRCRQHRHPRYLFGDSAGRCRPVRFPSGAGFAGKID